MDCRSCLIVGPKFTDLIILNEFPRVSAGIDAEVAARECLHIRVVVASGALGCRAAGP